MPHAATSRSTSPAPGSGGGSLAGRSAERGASRTMARTGRRLRAGARDGVWAVKGTIWVTFTAHTRVRRARRSLSPVVAAFGPLVETAWLRVHLGEPGLVVVDCRYVLGKPGAGEEAYRDGHIPGAAFLDVDSDPAAERGDRGRHPLPEAADFEAAARRAGIGRDSRVVAYDEAGEGGAARLWWLLRHFGHELAAVLDGGLSAWREAGGPLRGGSEQPPPGDLAPRPREGDTAELEELGELDPGLALLDARA